MNLRAATCFTAFRCASCRTRWRELGEDIVIVISSRAQRLEVLAKMYELDAKYDVVAPDVPVVPGALFDEAFVREHSAAMQECYDLLADERSREVFLDTVRFKLSGRLEYLRRSESGKDEVFENILKPTENEHFSDLGAYNGDTIRELLHYTNGRFASVTALEPDRRSFRKLNEWVSANLSGEVTLVQAGAWDRDEIRCFSDQAGRQSHVANKGRETQMRALDSVLGGRPCTYLKMDVEGAEREAISGAEQTIRTFAPKLNIAAYHRSEDFFELPARYPQPVQRLRALSAPPPLCSGVGYQSVREIKKSGNLGAPGCIIKTNTGQGRPVRSKGDNYNGMFLL